MDRKYECARFRATAPPDGWPPRFAILTACNPGGRVQGAAANAEAERRFVAELDRRRLWHWPILGGSPDFSHKEESYAIETDAATAVELGRQFAQEAIFWVEGDLLWLISCESDEREKIGAWRERIV